MKVSENQSPFEKERGELVDAGLKYKLLEEFRARQRAQNGLVAAASQLIDPAIQHQEENRPAKEVEKPVVSAPQKKNEQSKKECICRCIANSKGTDWLLALIAFLLFCILISK